MSTNPKVNLKCSQFVVCTLFVPMLLPVELSLASIGDHKVLSERYQYHQWQFFLQLSPGYGTKPESGWICQHQCDQRFRPVKYRTGLMIQTLNDATTCTLSQTYKRILPVKRVDFLRKNYTRKLFTSRNMINIGQHMKRFMLGLLGVHCFCSALLCVQWLNFDNQWIGASRSSEWGVG